MPQTTKKETGPTLCKAILSLSHTNREYPVSANIVMITVIVQDGNPISQEFYNQAIADVQLHAVTCTCGKRGCLIRYGRYTRTVKYRSESIRLSVQRVMCRECHTTHALLLSLIVPYSQIPLEDQQEILEDISDGRSPESVMDRNLLIDENNVKYIIRQYRMHWKQRLLSIGMTLRDSLTIPCLQAFFRQFMQIHRTCNQICPFTNTA